MRKDRQLNFEWRMVSHNNQETNPVEYSDYGIPTLEGVIGDSLILGTIIPDEEQSAETIHPDGTILPTMGYSSGI